MEFKGTQGEWRMELNFDEFFITARRPNEREYVCTLKLREDAKLISASKELLEIALQTREMLINQSAEKSPFFTQVQLTIEKALGTKLDQEL